ncbi:hypothetical protein TWF481_005802 [Arthrobotrys musiformis]|uniref:Uncharacterized protein n=1 Tax=Arthrobotrys musiformis TaxID=47236 RepID=A0AAV9WFF0_9PEZI
MSRRLSTRHQNNVKKAAVAETVSLDAEEKSAPSVKFIGVKQYYTEEQRLKSFASPPVRKRQSNAKKGSKASKWNWPVNHPAAELMARAGFYFKPTQGEEDNAACFLCQKNMSFWEPEDDPAEQHGRHGTTCGWALTMCRDLVVEGAIVAEPLGEEMCQARRMTFDQWWPHEDKKDWNPTVDRIVMAGFIFRPRSEGDDTVFCPYCSLSIDAWEKDDDPRQAHETLGSGNCLFLQQTMNASISTVNEREKGNNTLGIADAGEGEEEKPGSKRRVSRARKPSANPRKKTTPKSKLGQDGQQDLAVGSGNAEDGTKDSKKPARGKKRGSAAMEEGGKKLLFPGKEEEGVIKAVGAQQAPPEGHETQKPRPTKRRVTRASMANQPQALNLVVSAPDHLAYGDDEKEPQNALVKQKTKEKKKTTRSSTAGAKTAKAAKKVASKTPSNVSGPSDEDIDRELEREIMEGLGSPDMIDNTKDEADAPAPEPEDAHDSNELTASTAPQQPAKKATRKITKTKPISRCSPGPPSTNVLDDQENTQTKPRRKRLTRTKPGPSDCTDAQSMAGDATVLEGTEEIGVAEPSPTPQDALDEGALADGVEKNMTARPESPAPASAPTPSKITPPNSESVSKSMTSVKDANEDLPSTEAVVETTPPIKESNIDTNDLSSQRTPSTQLVVTRSTSISPTKDKDMKRKSDVVTDEGRDRRTSKKRRMAKVAKVAKPRVSPKKKETVASVPPENSQLDQKAEPSGGRSIVASKDDVARTEAPINHEDSTVEEQETILDGLGDSRDTGIEGAESAIVQGSTSEDNTIDVILNGYTRPHGASPQKAAQAEAPPASSAEKPPSSPGTSSDIGSQDSAPNTQFSMPASQMTVATSFQGSVKGVSFVRTTGEPALVERDVSPIDDVREQSIMVSPKQSRTPLSVLSKPHNGALALMTPRNRAEDVSFAPVQSQKPWKSTDVELYIDGLKENHEMGPQAEGLSSPERDMTVAEWVMNVSKRAEKQLVQKGELLVRFFEDEAERAIAAIEAIETE